jgi:hypothetical protein
VLFHERRGFWCLRPTTELSDSRPAVITPVTLDNRSAPPKTATLELRSGAAVRSSELVSQCECHGVVVFTERSQLGKSGVPGRELSP